MKTSEIKKRETHTTGNDSEGEINVSCKECSSFFSRQTHEDECLLQVETLAVVPVSV